MSKHQAFFFRFVLFLAGAAIIVLTFFLTNEGRELSNIDVFIWISVGVMYLILSVPFFFSSLNIGNFSAKIPSLALIWFGILLYIAASITVIFLLYHIVISLNTAVIIQSILFFAYLVNIYFAYFAVSHAAGVTDEEDEKKYYLTRIKSQAALLLLSVNKLSGDYKEAQKILTQAIDDIKYIYPVNNDAGSELETRILHSLSLLSEILSSVNSAAGNLSLDKETVNLQSLVNERKLLRN